MQLALDYPRAVSALVLVNGWLTLSPHTRRCFQVRERLLHAGGARAWVEAQPLFLYPAEWMAARLPRLEAEDALAISHFRGKENLLKRLQALKQADFFRARAAAIALPDAHHQRHRRPAGPRLPARECCRRRFPVADSWKWPGAAMPVTLPTATRLTLFLRDGLTTPAAGRRGEYMSEAINQKGLRDPIHSCPNLQRLAGSRG